MAKHSETFDHTADMGLAGRGDTLGELFEAMGEALAELICPRRLVNPTEARSLSVQAEDVEALCVDFLVEVLTAAQVDRFMVARIRAIGCTEHSVSVELIGEPYDAARHELGHEVKAVTYHQLKVAREGGVWTARVIVDV